MKKRFQLFALSVLCAVFAHAQFVVPSEGVFRIINVGYNAALMEDYESNEVFCTATIGDADDFNQLWILKKEGTGYSIQNAYTGAYIQTGNDIQEKPYWTGTTAKAFNIVLGGGEKKGYNIFDPGLGSWGLHSKGANARVVRWTDCDASQWKFEKVEVSQEAMTLAQAEYAEYLRLKTEFEDYCTELLANQDKLEEALAKYFEDAACTVLKAEFASASEEDLRSAMAADNLPAELIDMAVKVKTDEWAEGNEKADKPGWDSHYAKKFRVQMVEPHSIAGEITEWIGHQGHTNMDNPTGLYGNNRQVLYVMVEGEVKDGAELYATWLIGHDKMPNYNNGYGDRGVSLKPGLNIVPIRKDGCALYFNYLVHTFNKETRQFAHKLSDYDDLKIHVAGGYINGYYSIAGDSLYTPDNDDDWVYYEERANLANITILGRYEVLQFELNDVINYTDDKGSTWSHRGLAKLFPEELPTEMPNSPAFTAPNQRINGIVEAWDRIFLAEKMTLGVASKAEVDSMNKLFPRYDGAWKEKAEIYNYDDALYAFCDSIKERDGDYGEYYNHRGVAFGTRTGYMYGSWDHSGYHINTTPSILTQIATEFGPAWGPAHEIGHQHQALYTLNGEMEVTNNTFANVAAWYMGMGTSRVNGTEGNLAHVYDNFKAGNYIFGNNIWVLTQRYYRLWLYYHRAGNNTQFFPRLFELIRQKPMERSYGSGSEMRPNDKGVMEETGFQLTNGYNSYLHFYQLCCEAAQEDLTEFFRAYGCFVPVDGVFQGDYTNSKYYTTQEEIDKAIAEVKAKNYPINNKVLFINDCTPDTTYCHDGETHRSFWDPETGAGKNGEVGLYVDYLNETPITGEYVYSLSLTNFKIIVEGGSGAVGFAIYNKEGEILAFSNNHNFYLNESTSDMLRAGEATIYAVSAKGDDVEIINKALQGTPEEQLKKLKEALVVAEEYAKKTDDTGTKIGYLIPDSIVDYMELISEVKRVIEEEDTAEYKYGEWYVTLDAENVSILNNNNVQVPLIPNNFYSISNSSGYLDKDNLGLPITPNTDEELPDCMQWRFIKAAEEGTYYIQHRTSGRYISYLKRDDEAKAESADITKAVTFSLKVIDLGMFYIQSTANKDLRLYEQDGCMYAGTNAKNTARWAIQLEDDMLALPETSTNDDFILYHLIRDDNGEQAYNREGLISTKMSNDPEEFNYLFYFKKGSQENKYSIHSCGTGKPITKDSTNLYTDKNAEIVPEFSIALNEQGTGLTISCEDGNWYAKKVGTIEAIAISAEKQATWKLQRVGIVEPILTKLDIVSKDDPEESIKETSLIEGDSIELSTKTGPAFATDHSVTWSSSDETIAIVDSIGNVKSLAVGYVTITATANDGSGLKATCKIEVKKNVLKKLKITKTRLNLTEGASSTLPVTYEFEKEPAFIPDNLLIWSSDDETIAIVDSTGKVTAIAVGSTTIRVTANDGSGLTATCPVTVKSDKVETGIPTTNATLQIQKMKGAIIISGLTRGDVVSVYNTVGKQITTFVATDGTATINVGMDAGIFIVKVGERSIKVSL